MSTGKADDEVSCLTVTGDQRLVKRSDLRLRPGAYAMVYRFEQREILLIRGKYNGLFSLPGGGTHRGEKLLETLRREVLEETGLTVEPGDYRGVKEAFFYFDPEHQAYQVFAHIWECTTTTTDITASDLDEGRAEWVDIFSLKEDDCYGFTYEVFMEFWQKHRLWKYRPAATE